MTCATPIHREVYARVRQSIVDGRMAPGDRIAPTRTLAAQLGVARGTIDLAYSQLAAEGYILAEGARGTFVSPNLPKPVQPDLQPPAPASHRIERPAAPSKAWKPQFSVGIPALDLFPRKLWSTLTARHARSLKPHDLGYPNAAGDPQLRHALADYLLVARGIQCSAEQIIITGGYQSALGLIGRILLSPGDRVWVEDPGYRRTHTALDRLGVAQVPVPVDAAGMQVEQAVAANPAVALCVVTPANQFPLSVALSLPRRLTLLDWARRCGGWIVEDDYDGEFYYNMRPLPSLKSLDCDDRVFYVGTFSKTLFPGLRLGYVVVPAAQVELFRASCQDLDGGRSTSDQAIVADFILNGYFARHLKRMRAAYKARRAAAAEALNHELSHAMRFDLGASGLHTIGWLNGDDDDKTLLKRASAAGYRLMALSDLSQAAQARGLVVGLTNIPESAAAKMAQEFRLSLGL